MNQTAQKLTVDKVRNNWTLLHYYFLFQLGLVTFLLCQQNQFELLSCFAGNTNIEVQIPLCYFSFTDLVPLLKLETDDRKDQHWTMKTVSRHNQNGTAVSSHMHFLSYDDGSRNLLDQVSQIILLVLHLKVKQKKFQNLWWIHSLAKTIQNLHLFTIGEINNLTSGFLLSHLQKSQLFKEF